MNIKMTGENGMTLDCKNADESVKQYAIERIGRLWEKERQEFLQEVQVAIRNLKDGETLTLRSKPIEITLQKDTETA